MQLQRRIRWRLWTAAISAAMWGISGSAFAQVPLPAPVERGVIFDENLQQTTGGLLDRLRRPAPAPAANCPNCLPSTVAPPLVAPVDPKLPPMPVDPKVPSPIPPAPPVASFDDTGGGGGGEFGGMAVPNIMGNLFGAGKSISFNILRTQGNANMVGRGSTASSNFKIADNNSAIPRDRVSYRYNHFENAASVSGARPGPLVPFRADPTILLETPYVQDYDANMHSFDFEKTFSDGRASIQVRVPFVSSLSPNQHLAYGRVDPKNPLVPGVFNDGTLAGFNVLNVARTPQNSLGSTSTELGNIQVIFKQVLRQSPDSLVSAGLGIGIPTGPDTNVRITDFSGLQSLRNAEWQRDRYISVSNDTWALSPFVAFAKAPEGSRWFVQGFAEIEIPLNSSDVTYRERATLTRPGLNLANYTKNANQLIPPINRSYQLNEQTLMHLSWAQGFWICRNPNARFINGIAPTLEFHYTTALNSADLIQTPDDLNFLGAPGPSRPEQAPVIGNARNRFDLFDVTAGATFLLGNRATLATGVSVPLRGGDNRTYDWEFQVQLNYYFGAGLGRRVPNF